jgi:hypothetical protein
LAKRFFDTGTWSKPWFREMPPAEKAAWFYILTNCDTVGVWDADKKLANFCIGAEVDWEILKAAANGNIEVLENGKWWLVDFCRYQYGILKQESASKVQVSLITLLLRHGLWERYVHTVSDTVSGTVQDKDKEKDKVKDKEEEKDKEEYAPGVLLTKEEYGKLVARSGEKTARAAIEKLSVSKAANGYKYKSDYHAILNWALGAVMGQKGGAIPAPPKQEKPTLCPVCSVECSREFGYWVCPEHGRREEL